MPSETEDESKRKPSQLGILGSGQVVYDRDKSHVELHRDVADYLLKALRRINIKSLENQAFIKTITFDEVIGVSTCVVTTEQDEIVYARRHNRDGLTKFVEEREPRPCKSITVILSSIDDDTGKEYDFRKACVLLTAYIGEPAPREPTDSYFDSKANNPVIQQEYDKAVAFWNTHALVHDEDQIVPGTQTIKCPWG